MCTLTASGFAQRCLPHVQVLVLAAMHADALTVERGMQASTDCTLWVDLRQHIGDCTINMAGQYASWPVTGHAACRPFRYFRLIVLGGPAVSGRASDRGFPLSYLEFYGYFLRGAPGTDGC